MIILFGLVPLFPAPRLLAHSAVLINAMTGILGILSV